MWAQKDWKSGMTNFLRKACVSSTMLLWTHLGSRRGKAQLREKLLPGNGLIKQLRW